MLRESLDTAIRLDLAYAFMMSRLEEVMKGDLHRDVILMLGEHFNHLEDMRNEIADSIEFLNEQIELID